MKLIIAGSRSILDTQLIEAMYKAWELSATEIVSGGARGVDRLGERFAREQGIPVKQFLPLWEINGKKAGIFRNIDMGNYADALLAIWDGKSTGTKHMIDYMQSLKKPTFVCNVGT